MIKAIIRVCEDGVLETNVTQEYSADLFTRNVDINNDE